MRIVILGSGIVGGATGMGLMKGNDVTFLDINPVVVNQLRQGGYDARLVSETGDLFFDIAMVCVCTPSCCDGSVDLSYITKAMDNLQELLQCNEKWSLVVVRSTVPPTTTRNILVPLLERNGLKRGTNFGVCMNPEFLRAKSAVDDFVHPWATVIGELDSKSGDTLEPIYQGFSGKLFRVTLEEAEMIKYLNNLRNAAIISFSNEMWTLNEALGRPVDINKVLDVVAQTAESAWNSHYGSVGGQPYGGTCLPKDTKGLLAFASSLGIPMPLLQSIVKVNTYMEGLADAGVVPAAQIEGHCWQAHPQSVLMLRARKENV